MTRTALALGLATLALVVAEVIRPTHIPSKKFATHALVARSQASPGGATDTLDPELLDDLPRIHPDASGSLRISKRDNAIVLRGTIADPHAARPGAAVFYLVDGTRRGSAATTYGRAPKPSAFDIALQAQPLGAGTHRFQVGLVRSDQGGFFLLPQVAIIRIDR